MKRVSKRLLVCIANAGANSHIRQLTLLLLVMGKGPRIYSLRRPRARLYIHNRLLNAKQQQATLRTPEARRAVVSH
jgi:hypothetical protein